MEEYKTLVASFCETTGNPPSPGLLRFAKTLTAIMDGFEKGGRKAAEDGRPAATPDMVRRWVLSNLTDDPELAEGLTRLLYKAWTNGYQKPRCAQ